MTDQQLAAENDMDFGSGVKGRFTSCPSSPEPCGLLIGHEHFGEWLWSSGVRFAVPCRAGLPEKWWYVESLKPLTISPSVHCTDCGLHGFIREGRWTAA